MMLEETWHWVALGIMVAIGLGIVVYDLKRNDKKGK